jgi:GrpB-like predicted nucleotidyltransferase (UPF0157 family)
VHGELGLEKSVVVLCPHDPAWIEMGRHECAAISGLLHALAPRVVHVGSTAVPDLDAKPILDIAVAVGDRVTTDEIVDHLTAGGTYRYDGDKGDDGGLLFVRGTEPVRSVHVHVVAASSEAWREYLRFHQLLLDSAAARARYQEVKHRLAQRFPADRQGYTEAKGAVIEELLGVGSAGPTAR